MKKFGAILGLWASKADNAVEIRKKLLGEEVWGKYVIQFTDIETKK